MTEPMIAETPYCLHVGGDAVPPRSGRYFAGFNPTLGRPQGRFAEADAADVDAAVRAADAAFRGPWSRLSPTRRGRLLMRWGDRIAAEAERIGRTETVQNGKLLAEMRTQATAVADWLYYFGGLADKVEGAVIPLDRRSVLTYTLKEPLGVVAVIVPWNSPTFLTVMSVAPALAAGNTVVIKPSEVTPASALILAQLAEAAGIPPGVVNVVTGLRATGEALVDHPLVRKVAFTGGVGAGREIAARTGRRLVPCTLELGGKSPNIVFPDANFDQALAGLLAGIFAAAGQTCVAGSRAFVHAEIYDRLVPALVERARAIQLGDPLRAETQMGPVATPAQMAKDEAMVARAIDEGAELLTGGRRGQVADCPDGLFYEPTILHRAAPGSQIMRNEVFGPVLAIARFTAEDEVLELANDSDFGLGAGLWTADLRRAHRFARALEAGTVWINTYRALTFNAPFGGVKDSGLGRLNGIEAIQHFLQTKTVWCELSEEVQDPFVLRT